METNRIVFHSNSLEYDQENVTLTFSRNHKLSSGRNIKVTFSRGKSNQDFYIIEEKQKERPPTITDMAINQTFEMVTLHLDSVLKPGQHYNLHIKYQGEIVTARKGRGLYWSTYKDS